MPRSVEPDVPAVVFPVPGPDPGIDRAIRARREPGQIATEGGATGARIKPAHDDGGAAKSRGQSRPQRRLV
jgi:hypothetical protein